VVGGVTCTALFFKDLLDELNQGSTNKFNPKLLVGQMQVAVTNEFTIIRPKR